MGLVPVYFGVNDFSVGHTDGRLIAHLASPTRAINFNQPLQLTYTTSNSYCSAVRDRADDLELNVKRHCPDCFYAIDLVMVAYVGYALLSN